MTPEKAKERFDKMPPHLKEQVLKIDRAMKKKEENDKYNFSNRNEKNKTGGVKAKKTKAKKTKAKK